MQHTLGNFVVTILLPVAARKVAWPLDKCHSLCSQTMRAMYSHQFTSVLIHCGITEISAFGFNNFQS